MEIESESNAAHLTVLALLARMQIGPRTPPEIIAQQDHWLGTFPPVTCRGRSSGCSSIIERTARGFAIADIVESLSCDGNRRERH